MSKYITSRKGKIRNISRNALVFLFLSLSVGYFGKLMLPFHWFIVLPLVLIGFLLIKIFLILTISYQVDSTGVTVMGANNVASTIGWHEIERIEIMEKNTRIVELKFYKADMCFFNFWNDIQDFDLLCLEILNNARVNNIPTINRLSKSTPWMF